MSRLRKYLSLLSSALASPLNTALAPSCLEGSFNASLHQTEDEMKVSFNGNEIPVNRETGTVMSLSITKQADSQPHLEIIVGPDTLKEDPTHVCSSFSMPSRDTGVQVIVQWREVINGGQTAIKDKVAALRGIAGGNSAPMRALVSSDRNVIDERGGEAKVAYHVDFKEVEPGRLVKKVRLVEAQNKRDTKVKLTNYSEKGHQPIIGDFEAVFRARPR